MTRRVYFFLTTEDDDLKIPLLADAVRARGWEPVTFHTDRYPQHGALQQHDGPDGSRFFIDAGDGAHEVRPDDVIWVCRVRPGTRLPDAMPPAIRQAAIVECRHNMLGFLHAAPCTVIDPIARLDPSLSKALQHVLAARSGLTVPRTLITNDPEAARAFVAACPGGAIVKPHEKVIVAGPDGRPTGMPTTRVDERVLAGLGGLRLSPMILQEEIPKAVELRVIVMGSRVFSAAIDPSLADGAGVDWRMRGDELIHQWAHHPLPADVEAALLRHHDALGVQIGASDLIVTPDGRYVFLETNPNGQFFWLQYHPPRFPLLDALADVLTDQPGARRP